MLTYDCNQLHRVGNMFDQYFCSQFAVHDCDSIALFMLQIGAECRTCRDGVAVFDMSYFGKFYLTGEDAEKAVDWLFTNNMDKPPGKHTYNSVRYMHHILTNLLN
jgi:glycine cleavage system aminomethyltransferase T